MSVSHASMMHQALRAPVRRGQRVTELTMEAVEAWHACEVDARRAAWIAAQLGDQAHPSWRALGVYAARVFFDPVEGDELGRWQPLADKALEAARLGDPALLVPVWEPDAGAWAGATIVDVVALEVGAARRVASRTGLVDALGAVEAEAALFFDEPLRWCADPWAWLRAGGNGRRLAGLVGPAMFCPLVSHSHMAERVLLEASRIVADSEDDGHALKARAIALRRRMSPRAPAFEVDDGDELAELEAAA